MYIMTLVFAVMTLGTCSSDKTAGTKHISEFTDQETGKNPFIDLTEGDSRDRGWTDDHTTSHIPLKQSNQTFWEFKRYGGSSGITPAASERPPRITSSAPDFGQQGHDFDAGLTTEPTVDQPANHQDTSLVYSAILIAAIVVFFVLLLTVCLCRSRSKRSATAPGTIQKADAAQQVQKKDGLLTV